MLTQRKIHTHGGDWLYGMYRRHFPYGCQTPYEIWDEQYFLINLQQYADEHCFSYIC